MKLRFLLLSFFSLLCCRYGGVFAAEYPGDCNLVAGEFATEKTFNSVEILRTRSSLADTLEPVLDTTSLNRALLNLQKVCCYQNKDFRILRSDVCKHDAPFFYKGDVPDSFYLFDHVFDVIIRRLDGDQGHRYEQDLLDPKGEARHTRISSLMDQTKGDENTTPKVISDTYNEYWTIKAENILQGMMENIDFSLPDIVAQMTKGKNLEILKRYDARTLAERYRNSCNIAGFIYALFASVQDNQSSILATKGNLLDGSTNRCTALIQNKLDAIANYTTYVNISKSSMMLTDSIDEYVNTYLGSRLDNLQEMISYTRVLLLRVVKAVPKLIHIVE